MEPFQYIKKRVKQFEILIKAGQGLLRFLTVFGVGLFIYLVLDYLLFLPSMSRLSFLIIVAGVSVIIGTQTLVHKFDASIEIEANYPEFNGRLLASLSLYSEILGYSEELINRVREQSQALFKNISLNRIIKSKLIPFLRPFFISWGFVLISMFLLPSPYSVWIKRFFIPKHNFLTLITYPGDKTIAYGDSIEIGVNAHGVPVRKLFLMINDAAIPIYNAGTELPYSHTLTVTHDISYYATISDVSSDTHNILVIMNPWVKDLRFTYYYPSYTKIPPLESTTPDIDALYGTRIEVEGESNVDLESALIDFKSSTDLCTEVEGKKFKTSFRAMGNDTYKISLLASNGLRNLSTDSWYIHVWEDRPPGVEVLFPGTDVELPTSMSIPIIFHVIDDYGISSTKLISNRGLIKLCMGGTGILPEPKSPITDTVITYKWDLSGLGLLPGDIVSYWIEVWDNDSFKGPKVATSDTYKIYFPDVEAIYDEIIASHSEATVDLEEVFANLKSIGERLEDLQKVMSSDEEIQKIIKEEKTIEHKINELTRKLAEFHKQMEQTMWVDQDLLSKVNELQNLFSELNLPEFTQAIQNLEEALNKNPDLLSDALKNLSLTQEELKKRVERTIKLLKRFKDEQQLKFLAEEASKLRDWQQDINTRTQRGDSLSSLSEEEQALSKDLSQLTNDLSKLAGADNLSPSLKEELDKEVSRATNIQANLSRAVNELSKSRKPGKLQHQILDQLSSLASNLDSLYQQMVQQGKSQIVQQLKRLENEFLFLSFEEENVAEGFSLQDRLDKALHQEALIKGTHNVLDKLESLMSITPFIPQSAIEHTLDALKAMEAVKLNLEDGGKRDVAESFSLQVQQAMTELNLAVLELMRSESAIQSASSVSGLPELMQRLAQLTQQQQGLNQLAQSFLPLNLTPSTQQLANLISQQQALSRELNQIAQALKGKVLGDLGGTAREMEKVAKNLQKGVTKEIITRQERILKHLLDAQKSIYTKKWTRRRISEPGENFTNLPPLPQLQLLTKRGISQREILEALKGVYPKEYEQLIRAYFRTLATE